MDNAVHKPKDIMQQLDEGITAVTEKVKYLELENFKLLTQLHKVNTQMMIIEDAVKMVKTLNDKEIEDWRVNHYKNEPLHSEAAHGLVLKKDPIQKPLILTKDMEVKDNGHK